MNVLVRSLIAATGLAAGLGCALDPEGEGASDLSAVERSRFLFLAVFEGLWEDGADPALLKPLLENHRLHFVPKCPICTPVAHAMDVYVGSGDSPYWESRGEVFPEALARALRSSDREARLRGLRDLASRYVARRFERIRIPPAEKQRLRELIAEGEKEGMALLDPGFGTTCPSCSGATRGVSH